MLLVFISFISSYLDLVSNLYNFLSVLESWIIFNQLIRINTSPALFCRLRNSTAAWEIFSPHSIFPEQQFGDILIERMNSWGLAFTLEKTSHIKIVFLLYTKPFNLSVEKHECLKFGDPWEICSNLIIKSYPQITLARQSQGEDMPSAGVIPSYIHIVNLWLCSDAIIAIV